MRTVQDEQREADAPDGSVARPLERVMEAFLDGDARAFDALYSRMAPRLGRFLRMMCNDAALADDLSQATFIKVYRARSSYQRGAPLEPWIFAIARRTFLDHRRSTLRRPESVSADGSIPELPQDGLDSPEGFDRLDDAQQRALHARLASLPDAQREALVLLKIEGLSTAEAAAITGSTVGAVKLRAHRAYESLRKTLGVGSKR